MKRANGSGSVYKLSGNRRKPWVAQITLGYEQSKRLYKTIGYFETKAKAEQAISLDAVMPVSENVSMTLKELWEEWKTTRAYTDIGFKTRETYNVAYRYMVDYCNKKFKDLRLPQFQNMIDKADAMGRSRSTMQKIKTLSGLLSNYAITQDITSKNYAQFVRLPKIEKKKIQTFSDTEIKTLFKNDTIALVDTILILIYTGMRISELLTLTKFNVDLENMLIAGGVKTDAGKDRIIPIHPKIQKYIIARYNDAENYLIEYDKPVGNKKKGTLRTERRPYLVHYYRELYYTSLESLGIRRLTPHKTRHTFFTMLSSKCKDRKAMALVGGHTDPNFSDKTYVQPDIERLRRAIESI